MAATQKATITITGQAGSDDVQLHVDFDPPLDRKEVSAVAYLATIAMAAMTSESDSVAVGRVQVDDASRSAGGGI